MREPVLVAGATGYVGGRLVPLLLQKGYRVRVFSRSMEKVRSRPWGNHENLEIARGDMLDVESLRPAVQGCGAVYYLVHCMEEGHRDFSVADRHAACNMVRALKGGSARRLIYLSGLLPDDPHLSAHLRSRGEVAEILSLADTPLTTLRAAQLIGAGSASFEMIRWLVDRLPIMLTPRWTHVRTQPISITDTLGYLVGVLEHPETTGETYDICGPDILSYEQLFHLYAEAAGLRRRALIRLPWLSLKLSAHWISLVTPIPGALARPLIEGMRNEVVCKENRIRRIIPQRLTPIRTAMERALGHLRNQSVKSSWFDAGLTAPPEWLLHGDAGYAKTATYNDAYSILLEADPGEVWRPIIRIGGTTGWYGKNLLWRLRGLMDKMVGGPGAHRGRRSGTELYVGDGLDFWRVLHIRPQKRLLLFTEMRLPGEGLLDLRVIPHKPEANPGTDAPEKAAPEKDAPEKDAPEKNESAAPENLGQSPGSPRTELVLSLYFKPHGLPGRAYWHAVSPLHRLVFMDMLRVIAARIGKPVLRGPERTRYPLSAPE